MSEKYVLGLIGKNISYSFSKSYFEKKIASLGLSSYSYHLFDLDEVSSVEDVFRIRGLRGFNVTIPYKEKIIPYLDELSEEAREIGAVNCVLIKNNKKIGYNTDVFGFEKTLLYRDISGKNALVLGGGGAAKAVKYVLKKHKIPHITVSRKGTLNFENLTEDLVKAHKIIIQCTPVGTFPNIEDCIKFPFQGRFDDFFTIDLIYNPAETRFLRELRERGAQTINGLLMLEQQAEKAWEIWNLEK